MILACGIVGYQKEKRQQIDNWVVRPQFVTRKAGGTGRVEREGRKQSPNDNRVEQVVAHVCK